MHRAAIAGVYGVMVYDAVNSIVSHEIQASSKISSINFKRNR